MQGQASRHDRASLMLLKPTASIRRTSTPGITYSSMSLSNKKEGTRRWSSTSSPLFKASARSARRVPTRKKSNRSVSAQSLHHSVSRWPRWSPQTMLLIETLRSMAAMKGPCQSSQFAIVNVLCPNLRSCLGLACKSRNSLVRGATSHLRRAVRRTSLHQSRSSALARPSWRRLQGNSSTFCSWMKIQTSTWQSQIVSTETKSYARTLLCRISLLWMSPQMGH